MVYQKKENSFRLEAGNAVFNGLRRDPYGFWIVEGKRGKDKIEIPGEFTSHTDAVKAVKAKLHELKISDEERV
jgi:hypothetical protein